MRRKQSTIKPTCTFNTIRCSTHSCHNSNLRCNFPNSGRKTQIVVTRGIISRTNISAKANNRYPKNSVRLSGFLKIKIPDHH